MRASHRSLRPLPLVAAVLMLIASFAGPVLTPSAQAAPCCQSCEGWPEPPVELDQCWRWCVICVAGEEAGAQAADLFAESASPLCEAVETQHPLAIGRVAEAPRRPVLPAT